MKLRYSLVAICSWVAVFATDARAGEPLKGLAAAVDKIQTAFDKGDASALQPLMTEDHVTVLSYAQFSTASDQLKVLSDFKFAEYKVSDLKAKRFAKDVALVRYRADIKGTYMGKPVPSPVLVSEVWVKHGGNWVQAAYLETPLQKSE